MQFIEKDGNKKAAGFIGYNRNKKSLALDDSTSEGQEIFKDLAKKADVVVENLRPGSMKKLGLSYEDLKTDNPQTYQMIEIYKDTESHAHHSQTEHFKTLGGALAPFLAGAPEITVHEEIK